MSGVLVPKIRWLTHLVLALAIGTAVGAGAAVWVHHHRAAAVEHLGASDVVDQIAAGLADPSLDHVYVTLDAGDILDPAGATRVRQATTASTVPVYVVVARPDGQIGVADAQLAEAIADRLPDAPGVLFVWQGPEQGGVEVLGPGGYLRRFGSEADFAGDPAVTLPQAVRAAASTEFYDADRGSSDYWGGVGGGIAAGVLFGALSLPVVLLLGGLYRIVVGARLPGYLRWREET